MGFPTWSTHGERVHVFNWGKAGRTQPDNFLIPPVCWWFHQIAKQPCFRRSIPVHPQQSAYVVRVMLPLKDQKSADSVRRQLRNLSKTIGRQILPVYTSRKIAADFPAAETKPFLVNQQCVVYLLLVGAPVPRRVQVSAHIFLRLMATK
jgi:hypothetical protein